MSSQPADPDPSPNRNKRKPTAKPDPTKAAARPARPAARPTKPSKPTDGPARVQVRDDAGEAGSGRFLMFTVIPSWLFSFLAHLLLLLVATYFVLPPRQEVQSVSFEAGPPSETALDSVDISFEAMEESGDPVESELDESAAAEISEAADVNALEATVDVSNIMAGAEETFNMESTETVTSLESGSETGLRSESARGAALRKFGGTAGSESAVALALKWIVAHQLPDGGWSLNHQLGPGSHRTSPNPGDLGGGAQGRNAATALALLPLLAHGNTHQSGKYKQNVLEGLNYLMKQGQPIKRGLSFYEQGGRLYSHGLVAITLCEAFAMTEDPELAPYAQGAIYYIEQAQDPSGGGWRYRPKEKGDTSVVGWQVMALKSALRSGLKVKPKTLKLTSRFLDEVGNPELGAFGYTDRPGRYNGIDRARTAIGLLCRMYLGAEKDGTELRSGVDWLTKLGPDNEKGHERVTNMYYNYYATQLMKHYGGDTWRTWNASMRDYLVQQQSKEGPATGSWMFEERNAKSAGRLYTTSMACLTLEVYYRYLPLYDETVLDEEFPLD